MVRNGKDGTRMELCILFEVYLLVRAEGRWTIIFIVIHKFVDI